MILIHCAPMRARITPMSCVTMQATREECVGCRMKIEAGEATAPKRQLTINDRKKRAYSDPKKKSKPIRKPVKRTYRAHKCPSCGFMHQTHSKFYLCAPCRLAGDDLGKLKAIRCRRKEGLINRGCPKGVDPHNRERKYDVRKRNKI